MKYVVDVAIPAYYVSAADGSQARTPPERISDGFGGSHGSSPSDCSPPSRRCRSSALALIIRAFAPPPPAVDGGLLLVAICLHTRHFEDRYSYLACAATALLVTLTGLSCLLAVAHLLRSSRACLSLERVIGRTLGFDVTPGLLLIQLAFMLAAPVGLGMLDSEPVARVRRRVQRLAIQRLGFAALGLLGRVRDMG